MFLYRLASGLVFLSGGGLSRLGVTAESWPLMALGLIAAAVGLWHFFMGGTATAPNPRRRPEPAAPARPRESREADALARKT